MIFCVNLNLTIKKIHTQPTEEIGLFQKRSIPHQQRKFPPSGEGGSDCLKNVLNLHRMSGEGVLLISPMGGYGSFFGTTHFCHPERKKGNCLKNDLHYICIGCQQRAVLLISSMRGERYGLFQEQPRFKACTNKIY